MHALLVKSMSDRQAVKACHVKLMNGSNVNWRPNERNERANARRIDDMCRSDGFLGPLSESLGDAQFLTV